MISTNQWVAYIHAFFRLSSHDPPAANGQNSYITVSEPGVESRLGHDMVLLKLRLSQSWVMFKSSLTQNKSKNWVISL